MSVFDRLYHVARVGRLRHPELGGTTDGSCRYRYSHMEPKMNRSRTKPGFRLVAFSRGKGLSYFSGSRDIWLLGTVGTSKTRTSNCILLVVLYVAPLEAWRSFAGVPFLYVSCCLRIRLEIHGNIPARQKST